MRSALMKGLASMRVSADSTETSIGAGGDQSGVGQTQLSQRALTSEATPKTVSGILLIGESFVGVHAIVFC